MSTVPAVKKAPVSTPPTLAELATSLEKMTNRLEELSKGAEVRRTPFVRKGENSLGSRGYCFTKLFQLMSGKIKPEDAKVETDIHNRLQKHCFERFGYLKSSPNSIMAPFASEFLPSEGESDQKFVDEVRQITKAGIAGWNQAEINQIRKTLSWTDETAMGALVGPPLMGELVEVLRNNEVFMKAGAKSIGLPPNGRLIYPRQTGANTAYWIGENDQITASQPSTGDIILQAKKLACLVKVPNELFRYSSVSAEMFLRDDMMKVMGLQLDKTLLEGVGSSNQPKGLINYANINAYTSTGTPADGNSGYPLQPEDIPLMIAAVEESNAEFKSFVMRPQMWSYLVNRRADAVSTGDHKGPFVFNIIRELGDSFGQERMSVNKLYGYDVHKSTNISKTRTRGSGTTNNSYILAGNFNDYIVALSPTIEFAQTQQGDTAFQNDQTWLRSIMPVDGAPLHEASFVFTDNLLTS